MNDTMYTNILHYKGYTINVENYIYWVAGYPQRKFISMDGVKAEIDHLERTQGEGALLQSINKPLDEFN